MKTEIGKALTLGSLFDGIGGFPICAVLSGITPVWAAEIDPACLAVTRQHFPQMLHLGDVSKINGAKIPPVDIITFGSPCQDLSVAGARRGLKHSANGDKETTRSGLFIDAIRIIYEMREATNGRYPTYIVWENVEGAFNSCGGRDFQTVISQITKTDIPIPPSGKWAKSGVVRGSGICAAWRLFDAKYWGVPQQRKRVYLIGSFGSDSAAEILFEYDSVQRYLAPRRTQEQTASAAVEKGSGGTSSSLDCYNCSVSEVTAALGTNCGKSTGRSVIASENSLCYDARGNGDGATSPTITGDHNSRVTDYTTIVLQPTEFFEAYQHHGYRQSDVAGTLTAEQNNHIRGDTPLVLQASGFHGQNSITAAGVEMREEQCPTLTTTKKADVVYAIGNGQVNQTNLDEVAGALNCMHDQQSVIYTIDRAAFNQGENALYEPRISDDGITSTLVARGPGAVAYQLYLTLKWIVRRLTPRECERLQGFPDDWTVLPKIIEMNDEDFQFYKAAFLLDKAIRGKKVAKEPNKKQIIRWTTVLTTTERDTVCSEIHSLFPALCAL